MLCGQFIGLFSIKTIRKNASKGKGKDQREDLKIRCNCHILTERYIQKKHLLKKLTCTIRFNSQTLVEWATD